MTKELIVVAGPNGTGKSTFVAGSLSERACPYLCADLIAMIYNSKDGFVEVAFGFADEFAVSDEELFHAFLGIAEVDING